MIYVDRSRIKRPSALDPEANPSLQKEMEEAQRYFGNDEISRGQHRFRFGVSLSREVKMALRELFHHKCAYCEVKLDRVQAMQKYGINGDIEHFRPTISVLEAPDHSGYWWLANEWNNLLITCPMCNRGVMRNTGKGNRFPLLVEENRVFSPDEDLAKEQPLLLNPCSDHPDEHFIYGDDGQVFSETDKGRTSILVLGLNREDLVKSRLDAVQMIQLLNQQMNDILSLASTDIDQNKALNKIKSQLQELMRDDQEFAGLKRQFVQSTFDDLGINEEREAFDVSKSARKISKSEKSAVKKSYADYTKNFEEITIGSAEENKKSYLLLDHYIDKIELKNIKTFKQQVFDLSKSQEGNAPWMMLLGENGAGKSTVLKSISLNLSDPDYLRQMIDLDLVNPSKFIRHGSKKGHIKVWLSGLKNPRTLELSQEKYVFTSPNGEQTTFDPKGEESPSSNKTWRAQTFLLGYGATRLLPRRNSSGDRTIENEFVRVDNLFNPFVPLGDAEKWLLELDPLLFRRAALIIKDLLNMQKDEEIEKSDGRVYVHINGSRKPFDELSDGYQSVVALTADILQLAMSEWKNPDEARGIVMLDEVGAHLHPQWKMRIVSSLREALPHMQFIVSSHQPLCLRGIGKGEVMILRRDENREVEVLTDLPNPKELRISQILTSVFGLSSTLDPELEAEYKRYYELRALHELTDEEAIELEELSEVLRPDLMLGETLLDAQTYQVVKEQYDQYKASDQQSDLTELSDNTLAAVQSLWNN